ncbi:cysteine-rich receptor-like protein kinase 10 [Elaeis guineensis]|uniref:cysteine-rich receptor-like protein kinase 10 n=1 Tax=Elaeis guineensis var. tenera TaxID=51953 RepID=UPI003C6DB40B
MPLNLPHELLQILFLSSLLAATFHTATSPGYCECSTNSNFTTDSTYKSNLNLLLPSLISAALPTNFATLSKGQPPDQDFGLALCFADLKRDECQTCLSAASQGLQQLCPWSKSAAIWPNTCYLRYSNHSLSSSGDDDSYRMCFYNPGSVTERFEDMVWELLGNLTKRAAYESTRMFATGEAKFTSSTTAYGLAQCTRDQSEDECYQCLQVSARNIHTSECVWGRPGGVVVAYRCYLRFDIYPYYDLSVGVASPEPAVDCCSPPAVAGSIIPAIKASGRKRKAMIIFLVIPTVSILIVFSGAIFICLWRRRTSIKATADAGHDKGNIGSLLFDLDTIRIATNNFCDANKIGRGGFGPVYKGLLLNGQEVAVKRLSATSRQGLQQLKNEVILVTKLEHRNLVKLLGCCLEEDEKLLVYEFLPNSSLDKFLFDPRRSGELEWGKRYKIIEGIARGLLYLHQDSRLNIIHRDLKSSNILLDQYMNPKISDFGLAKLFDADKTPGTVSQIAGTNGYIAPEYAMHGRFSTKSDVFSFGVLVLEIVTGRRIRDFQGSGNAANLLSYAWKYWNKAKALHLMDQSLGEEYQREEALRSIHVGLLCVQEDPTKRPSMALVVQMLSGHSVTTLSTPSMPAFLNQGSTATDLCVASSIRDSDPPKKDDSYRNKGTSSYSSENDVNISEILLQ